VEDVDAEVPADRIEQLADACAENADVARRASLGLDDGGGLVPIDPDGDGEAEGDEERDEGEEAESAEGTGPASRTPAAGTEPTPGRDAAGVEFDYGDFEKEELIGSGGNADVYRAVATVDGEEWTVALKEPRVQGTLNTEAIERFVSEAETWDKLDDHDHIVSVVDYGSAPMPWIDLEYMEGGGLGSVAPGLEFEEKLRIAVRITDAVWHAHQRGIAHLDLKPANILFTRGGDGRPLPKVADWGLAKMLLDHSQSVEGLSPQYSAPEQFDRGTYGPADNQTDVYQLGVIFYELFTGDHPFEGPAPEVMHSILHERPDPPSDRDASLPGALDEILLAAMATDKSDRYEAVVYLRDALQEIG
jgi:serine/threonine protein kinase